MTTLYRPVLITSLDQANTLPRGSVVFDGDPEDGQTYYRSGDDWYVDGHPGLLSVAVECGALVTALVPVEAEEELVERSRLCQKDPDVLHRYVTGWQPYAAREEDR